MALEHLTGTTYGPVATRVSPEKVAEYVIATGDDAARWTGAAPPTYAGALLFLVAPEFLSSPAVAGHTAVLIHADQTFTWHGPLTVGTAASVTGTVERVRSRSAVDFVTFRATVDDDSGRRMLDSTSTFLLGAEPPAELPPARTEPPIADRSDHGSLPAEVDGTWPAVARSASRLDLVRYAAASGDFNPIHFDHEAARGAGLAGTVVHGLLMAAWMSQLVAASVEGEAPLRAAKFRFRDPLYPAEAAELSAAPRDGSSDVDLHLRRAADGADLVVARITAREA